MSESKTPAFLIERIKREIESANNPKGMSVHDGRTRILASDAQYLINRIAALQDELAAEKAGHEAWQQEGLKIDGEHEAKIRELENKCQLLEERK